MPKISIVLVHFKASKVLYDCIRSIYASKPRTGFEIIVVDNDEKKFVNKYLKRYFPKVNYIQAPENLGYGKGNNLGVENAKGDYVFILNPDTLIKEKTIDNLYKFATKQKKVGIVAPTLMDKKEKPYPLQGTRTLTPIRGVFALSFLNKIFPDNIISRNYWLKNIKRDKPFEVDVVPGSAFVIKRGLFNKLGGFDKNFFLYFEEFDLCKRVKEAGYKLFIIPGAKVVHFWAVSTPPSDRISKIFNKSRFYYFRKNYGIIPAAIVELTSRINKWNLSLTLTILLGILLRVYRLEQNIIFNGETGYDYLTIKGFVDRGEVPLVGPRTSHEWFHIGPYFYWIFALFMPLFNWDVVAGAYFMAFVGILSIPVSFTVVSRLWGKKAGILTSFFVALSPAWVFMTREARFNSFTSLLFFPFLYFLTDAARGNSKSIIFLGVVLGIMFSFFPAPVILLPASLIILFFYRRHLSPGWVGKLVLPFFIINIPYLFFNFLNQFSMITKIIIWVPYRIAGFFGLYPKNNADPGVLRDNVVSLVNFFADSYLKENALFAGALIFAVSVFVLKMKKNHPTRVLLFLFAVCYAGLFLHGDPPAHYYLVVFPVPLIFLSLFLERVLTTSKVLFVAILGGLFILNINYYFSSGWFTKPDNLVSSDGYYTPFALQKAVAGFITYEAEGREFALRRTGKYDYFSENFSLNYRYLIEQKGGQVNNDSGLIFTIHEDPKNIFFRGEVVYISNIAIEKNENGNIK